MSGSQSLLSWNVACDGEDERNLTLRAFGLAVLVLVAVPNSYASPAVAHSAAIPEPGLLALLGGGLVGLATLVRRYLSE